MRIAASLLVAATLAVNAWPDVAVVVWPLGRSFVLPEVVMLDELLGQLTQRTSDACFVITAKSAFAPEFANFGAQAPGSAALGQFAAGRGLNDVILLEWRDSAVRVTSSRGQETVLAIESIHRNPKTAAAVIATAMREQAGTAKAEIGSPTHTSAQGGPASGVSSSQPTPAATQAGATLPVPVQETTEQAKSTRPKAPTQPDTARASGSSTGAAPDLSPEQKTTAAPAETISVPTKPVAPAEKSETKSAGQFWYEMAVQSYREGNYTLALERLEKAAAEGAPQVQVLETRAKILAVLGETARQRQALQELVQLDPGRTRAVIALALIFEQEGLWSEAVRTLEQGIGARPDEAQLYDRLASLYRRQRRPMEALEVLRRGLEATGDKNLALSLAAAQDAAGDWRGAMALYAKLATDKDADIRSRALDAVGDSYSRRGLVEQAVEAYIEAARARGQAAILGSSRYKAVYNAADALVMAHVSQAWQGFEEIASGRQVITRESVLAALNAAAAQLSRALGLCDEALPPPDLADEHHQRQLYYALLREAVMAAVTYVDTGRADMVPIATERMRQAMEKQPAKEIR